MLKELKQSNFVFDCPACNGSLNSYDSYSCPICQGASLVKVKAMEELFLPEPMPQVGEYEFSIEHL
jgi:hypothetical protein